MTQVNPIAAPDNSSAGNNSDGEGSSLQGKYLTFRLGEEQFGVPILKVREIIGLLAITPVPGSPEYISGVINLRGKIIPVMDLSMRFDMGQINAQKRNCIIVVEVVRDDRTVDMGLLVDAVSEVQHITANEIEPSPEFGPEVNTSFIIGMAKAGPDVKILLDVEKIVLEVHGDIDNAELSDPLEV